MNAPKRWIVLVPTALMLSAFAAGCKTGTNRYCCKQTSCGSSCTTGACGSKSACCLKKNAPCTTAAACATNPGCQTSCKMGQCKLRNCFCRDKKTSCGACSIGQCKTGSSCLCKSKTSCGAVACGTGCAVQLGNPVASPPAKQQECPPFEEMETETAKPMPKKAKPKKANKAAKPLPIPKEATLRPNVPLPAPPVDTDTAEENTNPFLRVSQTQEVPAERDILPAPPAAKRYSKAWADALGLPEQEPEPIPQYRP